MPMFFFIITMRCRCFWPFLTIAIGAIIFAQLLGPIVFRWFFQFQDRCLGMIFCGKPKNNVFYDMLKFATNCAYISPLGVKRRKIHSKWTKTLEYQFVYNIFYWIVGYLLWAAIKADKLLLSSKSDGFQCHNHNRCDYFCSTIGIDYFPMFFR